MSRDPQTLASEWGQLIAFVTAPDADRDTEAALALAVALGSAITPDAVACSVTLAAGSRYHTPVWSDALALDLDRAQYDAGAGPCVATAQDGQVHAIEVMAAEPQYPTFTAAAVAHGVESSLSLPLSGSAPGALNLYARATSAYGTGRTRATAELLARCVGTLLSENSAGTSPGLPAALERRGLIERAQAELVGQGAVDVTEAYLWLTRLSRSENRSVYAIAADMVGHGSPVEGENCAESAA